MERNTDENQYEGANPKHSFAFPGETADRCQNYGECGQNDGKPQSLCETAQEVLRKVNHEDYGKGNSGQRVSDVSDRARVRFPKIIDARYREYQRLNKNQNT